MAKHRLIESGLTNCEFIAGDAYDIAKLVEPADFVFLANAFAWRSRSRSTCQGSRGAALKADGLVCNRQLARTLHREEIPILGEPRGPEETMK